MQLELTDAEKDAILRLGSDSDLEITHQTILDQLIAKGVLHLRTSDGNLDFTDFGESILDYLTDGGDLCRNLTTS